MTWKAQYFDLNDGGGEGLSIKKKEIHHVDYYRRSLCVPKYRVCKALHYQLNMSISTSIINNKLDYSNNLVFRSA